jgi:hypothetical protein
MTKLVLTTYDSVPDGLLGPACRACVEHARAGRAFVKTDADQMAHFAAAD